MFRLTFFASLFVMFSHLQLMAENMIEQYRLDPTHTTIFFEVSHLGFSQTLGVFEDFTGDVFFDPNDLEAARVEFVIQTASINTFHPPRDEHLRNADFFAVDTYPTITFTATEVNVEDEAHAQITGDLTLLGVTKEVSFHATLRNRGPHPFNDGIDVLGLIVEGEINRSDFGMDYGVPAVGDTVQIRIETELTNAPAE